MGKCAPGDLQQLQFNPSAAMCSYLRGPTIRREIHARHGIVIVRAFEQHVAVAKVSMTILWHLGGGKGKFSACHAQALHLRIGRQELMTEQLKEPLECRSL